MTGMKEGAGENPFADDSEPDDSVDESGSEDSSATSERAGERSEAESQQESRDQQSQQPSMQIPYKLRRDGVQDGRDRVPLFLQGDTKSGERDALRELEDRFDADVSLTDLREALVMVGLEHLDEVEHQLEDWGYGMTFDE